ncbi:hypothetical protein MNVM_21330 [Mycobacterium novum]|uniref:Uncharacterized protein n=1 Tax=Mycobacterium novum TaxID=2492438 RepID=A0A7I7JPU8_9MYCO|nr:hypothetical protein MNVM_21330 [Mycobacterium novum]
MTGANPKCASGSRYWTLGRNLPTGLSTPMTLCSVTYPHSPTRPHHPQPDPGAAGRGFCRGVGAGQGGELPGQDRGGVGSGDTVVLCVLTVLSFGTWCPSGYLATAIIRAI